MIILVSICADLPLLMLMTSSAIDLDDALAELAILFASLNRIFNEGARGWLSLQFGDGFRSIQFAHASLRTASLNTRVIFLYGACPAQQTPSWAELECQIILVDNAGR